MKDSVILFDGSWAGLLSTVFDVFDYRLNAVDIGVVGIYQMALFTTAHEVQTTAKKAERVQRALLSKLNKQAYLDLYYVYLIEKPIAYKLVVRTICYYLKAQSDHSRNFTNDSILEIRQQARSVWRERHRMKAFVRFKLLKGGLYLALIEPDFNVLPLIVKHFRERYADQVWLIYDVKREYGIYYDLTNTSEVKFAKDEQPSGKSIALQVDDDERKYDELWRRYFKAVNIVERQNTKLHIQHVPRRYWKYLNEKL